jgi:hypothetical protein
LPHILVCKSSQKKLLHLIWRIDFFWSIEKSGKLSFCPTCIHWTISGFLMYIYSTPMCWQYIASRCAIISVSVEGTLPTILPASKNSV